MKGITTDTQIQKQERRRELRENDPEEPLLGVTSSPTHSWSRFGHCKAAYFEEIAAYNLRKQ